MSGTDQNLVIGSGKSVLPTTTKTLEQWHNEVKNYTRHNAVDYQDLTEMMFKTIDIDPIAYIQNVMAVDIPRSSNIYRDSADLSQAVLANTAVTLLAENISNKKLADYGALIYSHSSVDENFYQSTACRIAADFGLSKVPHYSVAQLQGASFFQALEVAAAHFIGDQSFDEILYVAAEKWPLPYPRVISLPTILSDGAVAMSLERGKQQSGLLLIDTLVRCFDDFGSVYEISNPLNTQAIGKAVIETVMQLLNKTNLIAKDIDLLITSCGTEALDKLLHKILGIKSNELLDEEFRDIGYLCAADVPFKLTKVIDLIHSGEMLGGSNIVAVGVGLGGSVGAALFQSKNGIHDGHA